VPDRSFIDRLAEVWRSTAEVCAELTDEEWELPTDCPGWSVKDHVAHLIGTESMLLGLPSPPPVPPGLPHVRNPIGEMNEAWVASLRDQSGPVVLAHFRDVTDRRLVELAEMDDAALEADTPSPIGVVPYARFMDVRVMDCWVHEQDIRRAVGRHGHLDGDAAEAAIRRLTSSFPLIVGKRVAPPDGTSVVLDITGPRRLALAVAVEGGRATPVDAPDTPTAAAMMELETFVRLVTGRCTGAEALEAGGVTLVGDVGIARALVENLSTMP